jgi:hypothetical protein
MKFLGLYRPAAPEGTPPSQKNMAKMRKLIEEMTKAGVLLATEGCRLRGEVETGGHRMEGLRASLSLSSGQACSGD